MKLLCNRFLFNDNSTMSRFYINGVYFCDILEDKYRGDDLSDEKKIYGRTAIPCGTYKVILTKSNRLKIITPELLKVPFFEGIRIHTGNYAGNEKFLKKINFTKDKDILNEETYIEVLND